MNAYKVKLEVFEGPLDLLMHLGEKSNKYYDIPIAIITKQYLDYLEQMQEFNVEIASDFTDGCNFYYKLNQEYCCHGWLELKAKRKRIRQELVDKLIEYRKFKEVSSQLETLADKRLTIFIS